MFVDLMRGRNCLGLACTDVYVPSFSFLLLLFVLGAEKGVHLQNN